MEVKTFEASSRIHALWAEAGEGDSQVPQPRLCLCP